jgi:drug/metabolite transporter (DMT)-like permease
MTTSKLVMVSAAIEVATGAALIAVPALVGRVLLDADLSDSGVAVARLTGIALLCLGLACWPAQPAIRALFTYNLLAAVYLGYLRVGGGFVSYLLWPACALHAVIALLLARPGYESVLSVREAANKQ